jgi:uncharacterized protein
LDAARTKLKAAPTPLNQQGVQAPAFAFEPGPRGGWLQFVVFRAFEWNRLKIRIDDLPPALEGLRILHLSDLHLRPRWLPAYDVLANRLRAEPPDLILITGDLVEAQMDHRQTLPTLRRLIRRLTARLGACAILGNHDGDLLGPRLLEWGVHVLDGRMARLQSREATLEILGLPGVHRIDLDREWLKAIPPRRRSLPRIVLSHYPDSARQLQDLECDVILAGHTHGGQVCLPGGIPIITHDSLPRRMARGVHVVGDKLLVVHRGFGFANLPVRLFCPPEVIEIELLGADRGSDSAAFRSLTPPPAR